MNSNQILGLATNTEIVEKKVDIENALSRIRRPLDSTQLTVEVMGIFSLPEQWRVKSDDQLEPLYQYELEICGMSLKNAKLYQKELTEEEKAEIEASKAPKSKAPPAKDPKKKEEEIPKEELERLENLKKEKEEKERKAKEEWAALDEETKFYRTCEDPYKEPSVKFINSYYLKRIEQLNAQIASSPEMDLEEKKEIQSTIQDLQKKINIGCGISEKQAYELIELEEQVKKEKGVWIRLSKLPPPEEEITDPKLAAQKKAPAKGKGPSIEDMKMYYAKAWLDLSDLNQPGAKTLSKRVFLQTCKPLVKRPGDDGIERYYETETPVDEIFEQHRTYINLKLILSEPICATSVPFQEPKPEEVVPIKQFIKWPFSKDPTDDFSKQIALAVESLAKEYYNMFQNELEQEAKVIKTDQELADSFEERKKEFLYEINTQGKYHILKEKLKKTIVRIVKEHFKKSGSIRGLYKNEMDHFYSQLYAYLVSQMRKTVQVLVQKKRNELHELITVPADQFIKEKDFTVSQATNEQLLDRYKRLSNEAEYITGNIQEAEQYQQKIITLQEGNPDAMLEIGRFYLRQGKLDKADEYLRDSFSFQIKNQQIAKVYASFLLQLGKYKEAYVILKRLVEENYETSQILYLISLDYELDSDPIMAQKFRAKAEIEVMRQISKIPMPGSLAENPPQASPPQKVPQGQLQIIQQQIMEKLEQSNNFESAPGFKNIRLSIEESDQQFISLTTYLVSESLFQLAQKSLNNVQNKEGQEFYKLQSQIAFARKNYQDAVTYLKKKQEVTKKKDNDFVIDVVGTILIGHYLYFAKKYEECENTYLKVIRTCGIYKKPITDPYIYPRLGTIYMQQEKFNDACLIFQANIAQVNFDSNGQQIPFFKSSYAYKCLGMCLITQQKYEMARSVLSQANLMNPNNPDIWALLAISKVDSSNFEILQLCNEVCKLKISNYKLILRLAEMLMKRRMYHQAIDAMISGLRARAQTESIKHQKKSEEFIKTLTDGKKQNPSRFAQLYREMFTKHGQVKDEDQAFSILLQQILEMHQEPSKH